MLQPSGAGRQSLRLRNMKRFTAVWLGAVMLFAVTACGPDEHPVSFEPPLASGTAWPSGNVSASPASASGQPRGSSSSSRCAAGTWLSTTTQNTVASAATRTAALPHAEPRAGGDTEVDDMWTSLHDAASRCLWDAGLPRDVVQFLPVPDDETGRSLVTDPRVGGVILTGSVETARGSATSSSR